jgi:TonB-dependent starch-binding outer membrane protein SusC
MEKQKSKTFSPFLEKMKRCRLIPSVLAAFFILSGMNVYAGSNSGLLITNPVQQEVTITGTITDESGESLPGVSVIVRGTTLGTITGTDGRYSLSVPTAANVLSFTYVGMRSQDIPIEGRTVIDVRMTEDRIGLDEVVVVGYGTETRANIIGSVTAVRSEELTSAPVSQVSNMLAGRLPGGIFYRKPESPEETRLLSG